MTRRRSYSRPLTYKERQERKLSQAEADIRLEDVFEETDPDKLDEYARDIWSHVRDGVARNLHTRSATVAELTMDYREEVSSSAYRNINCPEEALLRGATRKRIDRSRLIVIAQHPHRTEAVMEALAKRRSSRVAIYVASDPLTPLTYVRRYLTWNNPEVVAAALSNPNLPEAPELVRAASEETLSYLVRGVAVSGWKFFDLTNEVMAVLEDIALNLNSNIAYGLVIHKNGNGRINAKLLEHPSAVNGTLGVAIASSDYTFPSTLITLCMSSNKDVRQRAAQNVNCPDEGRVAAALFNPVLV